MKILMVTFVLLFCSLFMLAQQEAVNKIKFEPFTRGYKKTVEVSPDSVIIQQSGRVKEGSPKEVRHALLPGEWEQLLAALEGVKLSELPQMEAEGNDRIRDAALHSTITVATSSNTYSTKTFDNYRAPSALEPLMEEIRNMEERHNEKE